MKRAKFVAMAAAGLIVFSAAALPECAEAAIGGMRTPRVTTPRMNTPRPQTPRTNTPSPAQGARPNQQYRPSQRASDIPAGSPSAAPRTGNMASVPVNGTRWGNAMRNMGLLAGGMMLGGLLGHMLGFGAGSFMADMFGLLVNVFLLVFVLRLLARFWYSFQGGARTKDAVCRQAARETERTAPFPIPDIRPPQGKRAFPARGNGGTDYEPERTAEWYRGR